NNNVISKKNKIILIKWQLICLFGLNLAYINITEAFDYYGYFLFEFNLSKIIIGTFILMFGLFIGTMINKLFYSIVWYIIFIFYLGGEIIYYQYNPDSNINQPISVFFLLLFIAIISKSNKVFKRIRIKNTEKLISIMGTIIFIPFFVIYYKHINLRNLFLLDVYDTRGAVSGTTFTAYLTAPLSRVILPALIVNKLNKKEYWLVVIFILMTLFIYLTGALKSILIGLAAVFFFYRGNYYKKT